MLAIGATPGKALATIWLSPTPVPLPSVSAEPSSTPAPTQPLPTLATPQATLPVGTLGAQASTPSDDSQNTPQAPSTSDCSTLPPQPFAQAWQNNQLAQQLLGCSVGSIQQRTAVFQDFEHGYMLWFQAELSIYVLSTSAIQTGQETDDWWRLDDTFTEGDPAIDNSLTAPAGLIQPARGFGKIWRNNGFVREATGWATEEESSYTARWLTFEQGWMMTAPDQLSLLFVMIPTDDGAAVIGIHLGP